MKRALEPGFAFVPDAVAIGASAGGIDALFALLDALQPPLRAALIVVLHLPEDHESRLAEVFAAKLGLPVTEAAPGAAVAAGQIVIAPPGYHLLVEADRTYALSCDAPVLFSRPSIDVLMESCADVFGPRLAGLVLTGANEDGAQGLLAIRAAGGLTAVQDPAGAQHPTMPEAAIRVARPDYVLPMPQLGALLARMVSA